MPVDVDSRSPSWDLPRSPAAARNLVETARAHGVDARDCLAGSGVDVADLDDPGVVVQAEQELAIARNLVALTGNPAGLGVEAGLRYQLGSAGILGFAMMSSSTAGEALSLGLRYAVLTSTFHALSLERVGEQAVVVLDGRDVPADLREFMLERDVAALLRIVPVVFGGALPAGVGVRLRSSRVVAGALAERAGPVAVEFDSDRDAMVFPLAVLDAPLPAADPVTARSCVRQCEDLLEQRRGGRGMAAAVRARLLGDPGAMPQRPALAAEFGIAERTLHRRLVDEGTSFRALVDEVRETLGTELLAAGLTVAEVARRLGYSETAAFTHAFTRWTGTPPSRYRGSGSTASAGSPGP